jgi:uncharacterized membrane protein HdeD (DUF308 family)
MMELELSTRHWWAFAERGIAPILFGILAFVRPGITLTVLVLLWCAFALLDGVRPLFTGALGLIAACSNRTPGLMTRSKLLIGFVAIAACAALIVFSATRTVHAWQAPYPASAPDISITNHDRVYAAEQYSNTDPSTNPG